MRKALKNFIVLCLVFAFIAPSFTGISFADSEIPELAYFDLPCTLETVKVGLCHGSSAVNSASLQSDGGSELQLGYFDYSRNFHKIYQTSFTAATVSGDTGTEDKNGNIVGVWHVLLDKTFNAYEEAAAVAAEVNGFPGYVNNRFVVLFGAYDSLGEANSVISNNGYSGSAYSDSGNSLIVTKKGSDKIEFLFDCSGRTLALRPADEGIISFNGNKYSGALTFLRHGKNVSVINCVGLEDYVKGVLPYEVSSDWPEEALKAQAVCARTYAINNINSYAERGFDVRDDTYSQVYKGVNYVDSAIISAVDETAGKFVRYEGAVCKVYYMSSDGGGTEDGVNVFGERRAYLTAVEDTFEAASDFYGKTWREEYTPEELSALLCDHGFDIGPVAEIKTTYSEIGNVIKLVFTDADGKTAFVERRECYSVMGLNSIRYDVSVEETNDGERIFVFEGCGWGHNCGMSQWGACTMANNSNVDCNDIISFYFSGAYIA